MAVIVLLASGCATRPAAPRPELSPAPQTVPVGWSEISHSPQVALGVPVDSDPSDDVLLDHHVFVVSYNPRLRDANWVAWKLTVADLGPIHRRGRFHPDQLLPDLYPHVFPADYAGSGYDRGHLCPSGDRTATPEMNEETFTMTNVEPQEHALNAGPWETLERFERHLAESGRQVFIVAGGVVRNTNPATIGRGVAVPDASWKVIAVTQGTTSPGPDFSGVRAIAVVMPNRPEVAGTAWTDYLTSVGEVEAATGYDLFTNLPASIQAKVERDTVDPHTLE
jgi:endonuclease G